MVGRRSRLERKVDLLRTIKKYNGYPFSRVSNMAGINYDEARVFFDELMKFGLVTVKGQGKFRNISITIKGSQVLRKFDGIMGELGE